MNKLLVGLAVAGLSATPLLAAGLDRSGQSVMSVFSPHGTTQLTFGVVIPHATGEDSSGNGTGSYDAGVIYSQLYMSYTHELNDQFSFAVISDQPYGVDVDYDANPLTSNLGGTRGDLNSRAVTLVGKFQASERISLFAGVGVQSIDAEVDLNGLSYASAISTAAVARGAGVDAKTLGNALLGDPASVAALGGVGTVTALGGAVQTQAGNFLGTGGYTFEMDRTNEVNYLVGAAYEIPGIALRVAGTYRFETTHDADATETLFGTTTRGKVSFKTPQSFNLEAQTGIAPGTLLTASYRWTEFSAVELIPGVLQQDLVDLEDTESYTLGVARQFSEALAASATLRYEPKFSDNLLSPLGPRDGLVGISLGARYAQGGMNISGGINYSWLGDARAEVGDREVAQFKDNHVVGIGVQAQFKF